MTRIILALFTLLLNVQCANAFNVDKFIDNNVAPVSDAIANVIFYPVNLFGNNIPMIILWVLFAGIFFTFYMKGISIWGLKHAIDNLVKKPDNDSDSNGEVSSFQALATALSGTIGIGSIAGVAISISIGGAGAAFWIFAGASGFCCTYSLKLIWPLSELH